MILKVNYLVVLPVGVTNHILLEDYVGCGNGLFAEICVSAYSVTSGRSRELAAA